MRDKTIRSIGATVVVVGVAVAAIAQIRPAVEPTAISIAAPATETSGPDQPIETSAPEPFVYRLGLLSGLSTDNFWRFYGESPSVWDAYVLGPTKPALLTLEPGSGAPALELAAEQVAPTFDAAGWRVRVPLRDDLAWSDGTPITADDFVFTFDTVRRLRLGGSWAEAYPSIIDSAVADGPHHLRIELSERPTLATWPHAIGLAPIMPAHHWKPLVEDITDAEALFAIPGIGDPGGGLLRLAEVGDDLIVSTANAGYTIGNAPDRVEYHLFPDESAAVAAMADGKIDTVLSPRGLTREQVAGVQSDPGVSVLTSPANGVRYLGFNLERQPMADSAFRRSVSILLDREQMAAEVDTTGEVASSFISSANGTWFDAGRSATDEWAGTDTTTRLSEAVTLLRAAGYTWDEEPAVGPEGVTAGAGLRIQGLAPAPLTILTPGDAYDPSRPVYAAEIAEVLGWIGFDARPVETDFDTVVDLAFTPGEDGTSHFDMYLLGWTLGSPALPGFYRPLFATDGVMNNTGYESERFAAQLVEYESSYTFDDAKAALWEMESILAEDLPYLLLYTSTIVEAYRSDRVGFGITDVLGGLQGRLGGIGDVRPVG